MHILYTHCIGHHRLSHYIILYRGNRNLGRQLQVTYINNENSRHFVVGCEYWGFLFCTSDFYYFLLFLYIVARTHAQHLSRHLLRRGLARIPAKYYYYTLDICIRGKQLFLRNQLPTALSLLLLRLLSSPYFIATISRSLLYTYLY